jgi:hypothetical protein
LEIFKRDFIFFIDKWWINVDWQHLEQVIVLKVTYYQRWSDRCPCGNIRGTFNHNSLLFINGVFFFNFQWCGLLIAEYDFKNSTTIHSYLCSTSHNLRLWCFFVCLMVFNATFNNISVISWQSVLLEELLVKISLFAKNKIDKMNIDLDGGVDFNCSVVFLTIMNISFLKIKNLNNCILLSHVTANNSFLSLFYITQSSPLMFLCLFDGV